LGLPADTEAQLERVAEIQQVSKRDAFGAAGRHLYGFNRHDGRVSKRDAFGAAGRQLSANVLADLRLYKRLREPAKEPRSARPTGGTKRSKRLVLSCTDTSFGVLREPRATGAAAEVRALRRAVVPG